MNSVNTLTTRHGLPIPQVGLGVFRSAPGLTTQNVIEEAFSLSYRHVDTARIYNNEADVGAALRASGIPREDVFITTKLWNDEQGYEPTLQAFEDSLQRMKLEYVDLYLLHWPVVGKRLQSWKALEKLLAEGRVRSIGVSNFMTHHLEELLAHCNEPPSVNQIELSPFLQQREVRALCTKHQILIEAYSPLTKGFRLNHPTLQRVAREVKRSGAQVLLRWGIQQNVIVLPKSVHRNRLEENIRLYDFELSTEHMKQLEGLEEGLVTGWDPRNQP